MLTLANNRITDTVADQDEHFLKMSEGPFSHDAVHLFHSIFFDCFTQNNIRGYHYINI